MAPKQPNPLPFGASGSHFREARLAAKGFPSLGFHCGVVGFEPDFGKRFGLYNFILMFMISIDFL
jgi:hypothetical protein